MTRIIHLERDLARAPAHSAARGEVAKAIHNEATAYRHALDVEQAMAMHDPHGSKPGRREYRK